MFSGAAYIRFRYSPVWSTAGITPSLTWAARAFDQGRTHFASANSAVQLTSIEMRSMSLSSAANRRTSCSRCWLASAGSGSTAIRYRPARGLRALFGGLGERTAVLRCGVPVERGGGFGAGTASTPAQAECEEYCDRQSDGRIA